MSCHPHHGSHLAVSIAGRLRRRTPFFMSHWRQLCVLRSRARRCYTSNATILNGLRNMLKVSEEVRDALQTGKPVVALESTIYTHGALGNDLDLDGIVRRNGGVPAVVGILNGKPTVGLTPDEVTRMIENSPKKVSRRDIAHLVGLGMMGQKLNGGTTIAATMILARLAGIRTFGTGGLGGVHQGGELSLDISADLTELGRTRMAVISSGCKGFLDIPRTLEYLETQGVAVSTFSEGRDTVDFPAFWTRESGTKSPLVVQTNEQAAAIILTQERLGIESGLLFANPIPEEYSIPKNEMDAFIKQAVRESICQNALGNENTPFILRRIRELTGERSVLANKALVRANVERATKIAVCIEKIDSRGSEGEQNIKTWQPGNTKFIRKNETQSGQANSSVKDDHKTDILVAGSVAVDLSFDYAGEASTRELIPNLHTSNPAYRNESTGGVGRNVALAAHKIIAGNGTVGLYSLVGEDSSGSTVVSSLASAGLSASHIHRIGGSSNKTAHYVAFNDANKNLVMAMADMHIFNNSDPGQWSSAVKRSSPKWLVVDGNWSDKGIRAWSQAGKENSAKIAFEPVSNEKSARLFRRAPDFGNLGVYPHPTVDLATPNQHELSAMHVAAQRGGFFAERAWWHMIDSFGLMDARERFIQLTSVEMTDAGTPQQIIQLLPYIPTIVVKLGQRGALLATILTKDDPRLIDPESDRFILVRSHGSYDNQGAEGMGGIYMRLFPPAEIVPENDVVSVNGVGDTFLGALIAGLVQGGVLENIIPVAQVAAVLTLKSREAVSEDLGGLAGGLKEAVARGKSGKKSS